MKAHVEGRGLPGAGFQMTGHPPTRLLLVRTRQPGASEHVWGPWGFHSGQSGPTKAPTLTQGKEGWGPSVGSEWWPQPSPAHLLGGGVSTGTSTNAMGHGMTQRQQSQSQGLYVTMQNVSWLVLPAAHFRWETDHGWTRLRPLLQNLH